MHRNSPTPSSAGGRSIPTRSYSSSTTSFHSARAPSPRVTGNQLANSPRAMTTPLSSSPRTAYFDRPADTRSFSGASVASGKSEIEDVERLGYLFSLRVAVLHHHLANPPPRVARQPQHNSTSPMPSPALTGTSPSGSRLHFPSFNSPGGSKTPELPSGGSTPNGTPSPVIPMNRRKSSAFGLTLGRKEKEDAGPKLPKEFLTEFWGKLAFEDGDSGWKSAVTTFLGMVKKGTKTPSGLNLREVPTILEVFTSSIPPSAPVHIHQSHFLNLLYNHLPRSSTFSPVAKAQTDKDRDLLFRLRAEVQSYMLAPSPDPSGDQASSGLKPAIALGRTSSHSPDNIKRKPSPVWLGEGEDGVGGMIGTVGDVWGISREVLEKDVHSIRRTGSLDNLYMTDLKKDMTFLSALPPPLTPTQKTRQAELAATLQSLLNDFPELSTPGSPIDYPISVSSVDSYFVPGRKIEVFGRLTARASEVGHNPKTRDLVERCRDVWGIASRREKEKEMEGLVKRWTDAVGTREEGDWVKSVAEGVKELSAGLRPGDPLPPVLEGLLVTLTSLLQKSIVTIFPTTSLPPPPPPLSLLPLLHAGGDPFLVHPSIKKVAEDLSDELKAGAVGEYVAAISTLMNGTEGVRTVGESGRDSLLEGFENVAKWMQKEVANVKKVWGMGLGAPLNPAAIILSRQLPLFCAELQMLDKPRGSASDIFGLYEVTGRLLELWEELCPGQDHGFELDIFFEPHVRAWLRDTEEQNTHEWVSRAVGMDSWVPEGENKHSQSVIDLFDFIRGSAQVILHDLPLGEYKRAVYLIDLSKTVSIAVSQYAKTVQILFQNDMSPAKASTPTAEIQNRLGGKAGNWLAKGQQAVKNLERKKVEGVVIPPVACVKLTDMSAAQVCLEDLVYALEAEDTARIVKEHKLSSGISASDKPGRNVFTVTVMRGENMLGKGLGKPADAFVTVVDRETGERLVKSRTILGAEDPRWEQSFEISVGALKQLELSAYDRQLVGKHDAIGTCSFKLDPRLYVDHSTRDVVLPLNPRGMVHLRISMEGGEKHDVAYHLSAATRALQRAEGDMLRELVDKMSEFIRTVLSKETLLGLTKPLKDKKKPKAALYDGELESSLGPLFEYLNDNFSVFSVTLATPLRLEVMLALWKSIISILISLVVPPLSDKPMTTRDPLGSHEIDVVFKWLQLIKTFFNANEGGVEHGVPLVELQKGNYRDLVMLGQYLDLPTAQLKERASAAVKAAARPAGVVGGMRSMSMNENGVGRDEGEERMAEILLRIARTRSDMAEFLPRELGLLNKARIDRQGGAV
ncbi:hypothetical protein BCR39DRAFT_543937 [Naematelia encephala]|uniref:Uncharacterized protein n=1 Tax=Naematelia encephala TaxID=71784 RepID=A0A1Y2ATB8_9TREE|nr:hypothetical protein BCR39DRAFT_543937 [Naematelia encephala]